MSTQDDFPAPDTSSFSEIQEVDIGTLASDQVIHAPPDVTIRQAAVTMHASGVGLLVLASPDGLAGVVSERDVLRAVATGVDLDEPAATVCNDQSIQWAAATSSVAAVAEEMMSNYVRHVLIPDDRGGVAGVVSARDLLAVIIG